MRTKRRRSGSRLRSWLAGARRPCPGGCTTRRQKTRRGSTKDTQITFPSPAEAGAALAEAAKSGDETALRKSWALTPRSCSATGDKEADKAALEAFASKYEKMNRWVDMTDGSRVLYIGADNFAFPVPSGEELLGSVVLRWSCRSARKFRARDIGRNELLTIDACSALANAQADIFRRQWRPGSLRSASSALRASRTGCIGPRQTTRTSSPLASLSEFPKSSLSSLSPDQPLVIDGYTLRILTAQGDDAPGGAQSYIVNGKMTGGFAILATPVKYAETGIMTFMTGVDGVVYERDLGPDTAKIAASIQEFNPTDDWSEVE